jgi:hypothetical protein
METNTEIFRVARRQVERKLRFFIHLSIYLLVNCGLILVHLLRQDQVLWSFAPLFGWGIGVLFHGLAVFLHASCAEWKQRMIEKELSRH